MPVLCAGRPKLWTTTVRRGSHAGSTTIARAAAGSLEPLIQDSPPPVPGTRAPNRPRRGSGDGRGRGIITHVTENDHCNRPRQRLWGKSQQVVLLETLCTPISEAALLLRLPTRQGSVKAAPFPDPAPNRQGGGGGGGLERPRPHPAQTFSGLPCQRKSRLGNLQRGTDKTFANLVHAPYHHRLTATHKLVVLHQQSRTYTYI